MATARHVEDCIRFSPPDVEGLPEVTEVAIFANRLEVQTEGKWAIFQFKEFAQRQENILSSWLKWLFGKRYLAVGEREFCTGSRYVSFFTTPRLKIYTPPDSDAPYAETYIYRINAMLAKGKYFTWDLS